LVVLLVLGPCCLPFSAGFIYRHSSAVAGISARVGQSRDAMVDRGAIFRPDHRDDTVIENILHCIKHVFRYYSSIPAPTPFSFCTFFSIQR
jgi:hypothetical protein